MAPLLVKIVALILLRMAPAKFESPGSIAQLIRQKGPIVDRTFAIEFLDPGVPCHDFTRLVRDFEERNYRPFCWTTK